MITTKVILKIFFIIFCRNFASGAILFPSNDQPAALNKSCIIEHSGLPGFCVPWSKCKNAQFLLKNHKIQPSQCYYDSSGPVVCCPDIFDNDFLHKNCRKSKIQCHKDIDNKEPFKTDCWIEECNKKYDTASQYEFRNCNLYFALFGTATRIGDFPFMVALGFREFSGNITFNCGGFLVTKKFVVTAAHCTNFGGDAPVVVRTGGIDLDNRTHTNLDIPIRRIFNHPLYNSNQAYNDIALIELERDSIDSSRCLTDDNVIDGINVIFVGYGQTSFGGPSSNQLLQIELSTVETENCKKHYPPDSFLPKGLLESQLCAVDLKEENSQDTCQGDSGGPLLQLYNGIPKLFGVTSFGHVCGSKLPGVYTRVSYYKDWIESVIWKHNE